MPTDSSDYYAILGVAKNAPLDEIKAQYKKLVKENHPDQYNGLKSRYEQNGDNALLKLIKEKILESERFCKLLNEAFGMLSDPVKRKQYDAHIFEPVIEAPRVIVFPRRLSFGNLLEGQKKSSFFTIKNEEGRAASIDINWEGEKPDWGDLVVEPDESATFPIKITVAVNPRGTPSGQKSDRVVVIVDGVTFGVEVLLNVEKRVELRTTPPTYRPSIATPAASTLGSMTTPRKPSRWVIPLILLLIMICGGALIADVQNGIVLLTNW